MEVCLPRPPPGEANLVLLLSCRLLSRGGDSGAELCVDVDAGFTADFGVDAAANFDRGFNVDREFGFRTFLTSQSRDVPRICLNFLRSQNLRDRWYKVNCVALPDATNLEASGRVRRQMCRIKIYPAINPEKGPEKDPKNNPEKPRVTPNEEQAMSS